MISAELISGLSVASILCAGLALLCAIFATAIIFKYPPAQMKALIEEAKTIADPKHRKAVLQLDKDEMAMKYQLLQVPSTAHLEGWMGTMGKSEGVL